MIIKFEQNTVKKNILSRKCILCGNYTQELWYVGVDETWDTVPKLESLVRKIGLSRSGRIGIPIHKNPSCAYYENADHINQIVTKRLEELEKSL